MQSRLLWLSAAAVSLCIFSSSAHAGSCSQTEVQTIVGLYQSAAKLSGCAKYATVSSSGAVKIAYTCSATNCVPIMQELARKLPDCTAPTTGVNYKQELEYGLYAQCKFCTDTQDDQITALWKAAAQTASCATYASSSSSSTSFSWPCSASGCTAVLKDLAGKVPDCFTGTVNEMNRILKAVSACTATTPSTNVPSPVSTPSSVATATPVTPAPASGTSSPSTTASPSTTTSPSSNSNSSGSSGVCSEAEQASSAVLWEGAATDSSCSKYATVSSTQVLIVWPCSATSCTSVMADVGAKLPSCVLPGLATSEKATVLKTVANCEAGTSGSSKETAASDTLSSSSSVTPAPSYSSSTCTATQVKSMASDYLATAKSAECKQYATITAYRISIYAPCASSCVTKSFRNLAEDVPNCVYAYEDANKKRELQVALASCPPLRSGRERGRFLETSASDYMRLEFTATTTIDASSSMTSAPVSSSARRVWLWLEVGYAVLLAHAWTVLKARAS